MSNKNAKRKPVGYRNATIFCFCALIFMLVQWVIFYFGMHLNSILLAFQYFDANVGEQVYYSFDKLFTNFSSFVVDLFRSDIGMYFINGVFFHSVGLIALPISLMVSYAIVKKLPLAGAYKIVLFLPSVISSMVLSMLFRYALLDGFRGIWLNVLEKPYADFPALLVSEKYALPTLIIYHFFFAIPGSLLINIGTMSRVPEDLIEYGNLEGISMIQEFWYVMLPLMFPVLQVYCLGMFVGFFTAEGPLYNIYGSGQSTRIYLPNNAKTLGYYMFVSVISDSTAGADPRYMYGYTAAANLLIGVISVPIVYGTKKLLDLFDPDAEF